MIKHAHQSDNLTMPAGLPRLSAALSDLVVYGEMTYSGRLPTGGQSATEIAALIAELRALG